MEDDPLIEHMKSSPEKIAKLHVFFTIAYIMFLVFVVVGLIAVILFYFDMI
jgi:hypothetical protein